MYETQLVRGALINLLGLAARLVHPLFFVVITRLFGPQLLGVYLLAVFIVDVASSAVSAGYNDAATVFGSRHSDDEAERGHLGRVFANALGMTMAVSLLLVLVAWLGADALVGAFYAGHPELAPALRALAWSLPFVALSQVCIAATKARMHMQYDAAINGMASPVLLLAFSLVAWWVGAGLTGLVYAYVGARAVVAALSLWGFRRVFGLRWMLASITHFRIDWPMLAFAVPQSLNMTFSKYATRVDVIMLAAFGYASEVVAFYAAGALITYNLRQIKIIFSSALGPIVARHHRAGERDQLEATLSRTARWTTTLIAASLPAAVILRADILELIHPSYVSDSTFVVVLLAAPFLSCSFGLAGNCIVYTGHSGWTLANGIIIATANTGLNLALIPRYGLVGAAAATAVASLAYSILQLLELWYLERVTIRWRQVFRPHVALLAVLPALALLWDPAAIGGVGTRVVLSLGFALAYAVLLVGLRHPEAMGLLKRLRKAAFRD